MIPDGFKVCSRCLSLSHITNFYKAVGNTAGLQSWCKACDHARRAASYEKKMGGLTRVSTRLSTELRKQGLKRCPRCKQIKPVAAFYESGDSNQGTAAQCIVCSDIIRRARPKGEGKTRYKKNVRGIRNNILIRDFGITLEQYERMAALQNNLCAICGDPEKGKGLAVDHNHQTGKVRELLCGRCNPAIGFLRDDPVLARKLASYLDKHEHSGS